MSDFDGLADTTLRHLVDVIDAAIGEEIDVDLQGGVLTIDLPSGHYVLNKHGPNRQLWLASPESGAWHFDWDAAAGVWRSSRGGEVILTTLLSEELEKATGVRVAM
ncbi:MAG: iron donor protein CyaY [Alphaproteobacteria bacterium]|nr:iron donor protein CyaY [Alphaproteobacteria bacterium]